MSTLKASHVYNVDSRFVFATLVKERLALYDMSQAELSRRSGVSEGVIRYVLQAKGYATWDRFLALCATLYIDPTKVMDGQYTRLATSGRLDQAARDATRTISGAFQ